MPSDRRLVLTAEAEDDLAAVWRYTADAWDDQQADVHLDRIRNNLDQLVIFPLLGPPRDDLQRGLRHLIAGLHIIFYRIGDDALIVRRVFHQRRDVKAALKA